MRSTTEKEVQAVLKLDGPARVRHFVKRVADEELVWGLHEDGWVLMANDQRARVFPLWPAREYAELCATGDWAGCEARSMDLDYLMNDLGPRLAADSTPLGLFPTPGGKGVTLTFPELAEAISKELENY